MSDKNTYYLADWMAGKLSDAELKSRVTEAEYETYLKIRIATEHMAVPEFDVDENYRVLQERIRKSKLREKPVISHWVYALAASLLLFFGVTYYLNTETVYHTKSGQMEQLALNEGTHIDVNANSAVSFPKYRSQRSVTLDGEAYFEVTKKGDFQVNTPNGVVRVLGTKFNVISRDGFFEVICYEGKVRVETEAEKVLLKPGEAWHRIYTQTDRWKTSEHKASWLSGVSSFRSVPLSYVLKSIENQYGISIDAKAVDTTLLFTGSFTHKSLQTALKSVCIPLQLNYKIVSKDTVVLSK